MLVNGGAKARGALLRDVAALSIGVITIAAFLGSGRMSYARCAALLAEYGAFVLIVLAADLWHIFTRCADWLDTLLIYAAQKPEISGAKFCF